MKKNDISIKKISPDVVSCIFKIEIMLGKYFQEDDQIELLLHSALEMKCSVKGIHDYNGSSYRCSDLEHFHSENRNC